MLAVSLLLGLNGDVQYVIGGMRVAVGPDGVLTGVDTFTHRPLVYRAFILGLTGFLGLLQLSPASQVPFEISARLVAATLSLAVGMLLFLGVRQRLGAVHAGAVALAVTASLALAPNWDLLQAEWLGCLLAVLAVSLALLPASTLIAGALGGLLLVLAAAAKLSTAPYALIGLLAIAALDRRRTIPVVLGGATFGLAFVGLLLVVPHELRWVRDTVTLSLGSPLRTATNWGLMASAFGSKAATSPVLIVAPASLVVLLRLVRQRSRWWLVIGALLVFALAAAPLVAQKEAYLYRLSILPVAGAALVAFAAVELWSAGGRSPWWVIGALAVASGIACHAAEPSGRRPDCADGFPPGRRWRTHGCAGGRCLVHPQARLAAATAPQPWCAARRGGHWRDRSTGGPPVRGLEPRPCPYTCHECQLGGQFACVARPPGSVERTHRSRQRGPLSRLWVGWLPHGKSRHVPVPVAHLPQGRRPPGVRDPHPLLRRQPRLRPRDRCGLAHRRARAG